MENMRKPLLALALTATFGPILPTAALAQLHLEIAKAPEQAPKIAIVPFSNDQSIYPIVESDLNRSGRFSSSSKNLPFTHHSYLPASTARGSYFGGIFTS